MLIDNLIEELFRIKEDYGNINCVLKSDGGFVSITGATTTNDGKRDIAIILPEVVAVHLNF